MKKSLKLTIERIIKIYSSLKSLENYDNYMRKHRPKEWPGLKVRLTYAMNKTMDHLQSCVDAYRKAGTTPEYLAFDIERIELGRVHAKRDVNGDPIRTDDGGYLLEDVKAYEAAVEALKQKHPVALEFDAKLKEEEDVTLYQIPFEELPETLPPEILRGLGEFVLEPVQA